VTVAETPGGEAFDTVLCMNVLESQPDPAAALASAVALLKPGGTLVVLAPLGPWLHGSVDRALGSLRRFRQPDLERLVATAGCRVERRVHLNKVGIFGWWFNSRVLGEKRVPKLVLKLFDKTVWLWRLLDRLLPWPGLTLLLVARKNP
jgi:SAM-dependent methyltransferase